ncbi:hypothetical protein FQZ97_1074070 [compost metagenome]
MLSRNYWLGVEYGQQVVRMKCGTGLESETRRQQLMNMRVPERLLGCRLKLTLGGVGEFFHSHETILVTCPYGARGTRLSPRRSGVGRFQTAGRRGNAPFLTRVQVGRAPAQDSSEREQVESSTQKATCESARVSTLRRY